MKWAPRALAAVLALVASVAAVGSLLPVAHVASREARFTRPPADVFAAITDVRTYPEWRAGVREVEVLSASPLRWRESGDEDITFELVESTPPRRAVARIADPTLPFGGRWTYDLAPDGAGTRLTITENGEVYNPIFRFVARFVFGHTSTIEQFLEALHRRLD